VLAIDGGNGPGAGGAGGDGATAEMSLLIAKVDGDEVGFVVDDFRSGIDILLKPLEGILAGLRHYAGTALLGDGSVLLVLNLREIVRCPW
jgi:two-component system chemotaxis sensor kinase CheA